MPAPDATFGRPHALIIATDQYNDPGLSELRSPSKDAEQLTQVLQDPSIGGFNTITLVNKPGHMLLEEIEGFFDARQPDDLLIYYISCHGVKDVAGRLYFTSTTTKLGRLAASGISDSFIYEQVDRCRARKILLLLDCCYSGAYLKGRRPRAAGRAAIKPLTGRGRAVIASSTALEYSFEIDTGQIDGVPAPSVFTHAVVEGLRTGDADRDEDGLISVDDLYGYVYEKVREATPHQTPEKKWGEVSGDFVIAKNPNPPSARRKPLPAGVIADLRSTESDVREQAFRHLARLAFGADEGIAATARETLQVLADDESSVVSSAAMAALMGAMPPADGPQSKGEKRRRARRRRRRWLSLCASVVVATSAVTALAFAGDLPMFQSAPLPSHQVASSFRASSSEISELRKYRAITYSVARRRRRAAGKASAPPSPSASATPSTPATAQLVYEPWNITGSDVSGGIEVASTLSGADCQGGADTSNRTDAYHCVSSSGTGIMDPCFADPNSEASRVPLVCPQRSPDSVILIHPSKPLPRLPSVGTTRFWMIILDNGASCNAATGAVGYVAGMLMTFDCSDGSFLYGKIDNTGSTWMIYRQGAGSSTLSRVPIATAYS